MAILEQVQNQVRGDGTRLAHYRRNTAARDKHLVFQRELNELNDLRERVKAAEAQYLRACSDGKGIMVDDELMELVGADPQVDKPAILTEVDIEAVNARIDLLERGLVLNGFEIENAEREARQGILQAVLPAHKARAAMITGLLESLKVELQAERQQFENLEAPFGPPLTFAGFNPGGLDLEELTYFIDSGAAELRAAGYID